MLDCKYPRRILTTSVRTRKQYWTLITGKTPLGTNRDRPKKAARAYSLRYETANCKNLEIGEKR